MSRPARRATIIDVAERAGVSRQTVTRAINDMPGISAATRDRVLEAARDLNYRPSRFGRGLVEQGPVTLGVVIKDLSNAFFAELGTAMVRCSAPHGWNVVLAETDHATRPDEAAAELARRVDAIVGYEVRTDGIRGGVGMPVVHLDGSAEQSATAGVVRFGAQQAMADLARHLRVSGVSRPVVLDLVTDLRDAGSQDTDPQQQAGHRTARSGRARALADALDAHPGTDPGMSAGTLVVGAHPREGHRELLEAALDGGADALIAFNDELAMRLLRTLRHLDVAVPGRVRVVGVDGLEMSSLVSPELTTLAIDIEQIAQETVDLVAGMLSGTVPLRGPEAVREVPYRLLVRESA